LLFGPNRESEWTMMEISNKKDNIHHQNSATIIILLKNDFS
jgi:hypothetical protein